MSTKPNVKQPRREGRPRSSDKLRKGKREGTPDKPSTPITSQDALMEEGTPQTHHTIITNNEILSLQIKPEDLQKLRQPQPPSCGRPTPPCASVVVRKMKRASEWDKPAPRIVTVARPAPPDAPLMDVHYTNAAGPRFDHVGAIIEHSILGSVEDYKAEAQRCGGLPAALTEITEDERKPRVLSAKYERSKASKHPSFQSVEESNALKNWQLKMQERKRQQGHLSKLLDKPVGQLVMNQADSYRQTQELRYLIDRTIPTMDYGKGYRIGSEFWKQQERIGNDLTGTHMTLTQTERGYPPPIQHVGVPRAVLEEKGTHFTGPTTPSHKPWHNSAYLRQRVNQLNPVMRDLAPHVPDVMNLELIGRPVKDHSIKHDLDDQGACTTTDQTEASEEEEDAENLDPLRNHPDVHPEPVFGPSIQFAGKAARWTGDAHALKGQLGCEARIAMEAYAGKRTTAYLEVVNDGTTSMYYVWKKVAKTNPFEVITAKVQRFYFNNGSGVILPGDHVKFPFVFKSPNAGVFTEQWHFQTHPVVCGGAALVVTLRGTALQEDKYHKQRSDLENELALKQAEQVVRGVLDDLLSGVRTPPRPSSPVDAYITEEDVFSRRNPALYYHNETVADLRTLYTELLSEEEQETVQWDLHINSVKKLLMRSELEEDQRDDLLTRLNRALNTLIFPPFGPMQKQMYTAGYKLMCEASEKMVDHAAHLRIVLGLPEKEETLAEEPSPPSRGASGRSQRSAHSAKSTGSVASESSSSVGDSRRAVGSRAGQKPDTKDKKKEKETKGGSKTPAKETPKPGGKVTPGPGTQTKRPQTRGTDPTAPSGDRITSPTPARVEPIVHTKYREKIYAQTYMVVSEMIDQMSAVFADIECGGCSRTTSL